jgi:hypothetical protein
MEKFITASTWLILGRAHPEISRRNISKLHFDTVDQFLFLHEHFPNHSANKLNMKRFQAFDQLKVGFSTKRKPKTLIYKRPVCLDPITFTLTQNEELHDLPVQTLISNLL